MSSRVSEVTLPEPTPLVKSSTIFNREDCNMFLENLLLKLGIFVTYFLSWEDTYHSSNQAHKTVEA